MGTQYETQYKGGETPDHISSNILHSYNIIMRENSEIKVRNRHSQSRVLTVITSRHIIKITR